MSMPARKLDSDEPVGARLARLEIHVEYFQSAVSEIKGDIRRLEDKIYGVSETLSAKIDDVRKNLEALAARIDAAHRNR